jgi:hypothetical protein
MNYLRIISLQYCVFISYTVYKEQETSLGQNAYSLT